MKTKKLISLLLSVAMILTTLVVPMSASAATATTWETVFEHDFDSKTQAPLILSNNRSDGSSVYGVINGDIYGNSTKYGRFDANDYNDGATGNHRKGWDLDNTYTTGKMAVEFDFKREDNNSDGFVYLSRADGNDIFVLTYFKNDGTVGAFANNTDVTKYSDTKLTLNTWYTYRAEIDLSTRAFEAWIVTKDGNSQYAHIKATAPAYSGAWNQGWLQNNDFAAFGAMKDVCVDNISVAKQVQTTLPEGTIFVHDFDNQTQAPLILSDGGKDGSGVYGVFNGDAYGNDTKYGRFDANDYNDGATGNHRKGWKFGQTYSTGKIQVEFNFKREDNNSDGFVYLSRADGNDFLTLTYFKNDGTVGAFANNTDVTKYSNDALTLNTWYTYKAVIDLDTKAFEAWITTTDGTEYAHINATVPAYSAYHTGWLQNNDFAAFGAMKDVCLDNISVVEFEEEEVEEYVPEEGTVFWHNFDNKTAAPRILSDGGKDGSNVYAVINGDAYGNDTKYGRLDSSDYNDGATGNHRKGWMLDKTLSTEKIKVEFDFKREDNNEPGYVYLSNAAGGDIFVLTFFKNDGTVGAFANNTDVTKYSEDALTLNTWYTYKAEIDLSTRAFEAWITIKDGNTEYAHIKATAPAYSGAWNQGWLQNNDFAAFGAMKDICVDNIAVVEVDEFTGSEGEGDDTPEDTSKIYSHDFDSKTEAPVLLSNNGSDGTNAYGVIDGDENGNSTKYAKFDADGYSDGASGWHRKGWKFNKISSGKIVVEFKFLRENNSKKGYVYLSNAAGDDLLVLTFFNDDGTVGAFANNTNVTKYSEDALALNTWYNYRAEIDIDTRGFEAWITNTSDSSEYAHINSVVPEKTDMYSGWIAENNIQAFGAMLNVCVDDIDIRWNYVAPTVSDEDVAIRNVFGDTQTDMTVVNPNVTAIDIDFGTLVNEASLEGAVTLTKTDEPTADVELTGELIGDVYTVSFDPLVPDSTYELKVSKDVVGKGGETLGTDYVLSFTTAAQGGFDAAINGVKVGGTDVEDGAVIPNGTVTVDVSLVNTSGENKEATVFIAYYAGNAIQYVDLATVPVNDGKLVEKDDVTFTLTRESDTDCVKIMVWDGNVTPLCIHKEFK